MSPSQISFRAFQASYRVKAAADLSFGRDGRCRHNVHLGRMAVCVLRRRFAGREGPQAALRAHPESDVFAWCEADEHAHFVWVAYRNPCDGADHGAAPENGFAALSWRGPR